MICVVPSTDRRLTIKSCNKIMQLFPKDDIKLIELQDEYRALKWAEKVARFFAMRGKKVYVEITNGAAINNINTFAEIGCHLIFVWYGMKRPNFMASFYMVSVGLGVLQRYPGTHITFKYIPVETDKSKRPALEEVQANLEYLVRLSKDNPNISCEMAYPIPWSGGKRIVLIRKALKYLAERDPEHICTIVKCGEKVVLPNTNIYKCRYCKRKQRKQFFGNADRDKNVLGTLRRGMFRRRYRCNICGRPAYYNQ
jgi:hypothetical protein